MKLTLQNLQNNITADFTSRDKEGKKNRYEIFLATFFKFIFLEKKMLAYCRIGQCPLYFCSIKIKTQNKLKLQLCKALMYSEAE